MIMKKIYLLVTLLLCAILLFSCKGDTDIAAEETTTEEIIDETAIRKLTYESSDKLMGTVSGALNQELTYNDVSEGVKANEKSGFKFAGWSDGNPEYSRTDTNLKADTTIKAIFDYEYRDMPILDIRTTNYAQIMSKNDYIGAEFTFANTDGTRRFESIAGEIRGRGNATWGMDKKSYRIHFDQRLDVIEGYDNGAKSWVLLANHCDQTMLRNHTAFNLGKILNIPYSTESIFVEVYLNGKYDGVYQIVEQTQVQENRVNIEDTRTDTSNGYLIELDRYFEGQENVDFVVVNNVFYSIRSQINNPTQIDYIKNYLEQIESAVRGNNEAECYRLIDMDSMVATYILQEFMKNIDVGWSSFFMFIEEDYGKMYFGPPWDFDLTAGNDHRLDNGSWDGIYVGDRQSGFDQRHRWFPILIEYDWFRRLVQNMWEEKKDEIIAYVDEVYQFGKDNIKSFNRNFERWPIWGWRINQEPEHIMALNTYGQHIDYLNEWLHARFEWLDEYFMNEEYITVDPNYGGNNNNNRYR